MPPLTLTSLLPARAAAAAGEAAAEVAGMHPSPRLPNRLDMSALPVAVGEEEAAEVEELPRPPGFRRSASRPSRQIP